MFDVSINVLGGAALVVAAIPLLAWSFSGTRGRAPLPATAIEGRVVDERQVVLGAGLLDRIVLPSLKAVGRGVRRISPAGWMDSLERRVRLAGSSSGWTIERALVAKVVLGLGGAFAGMELGGGGLRGIFAVAGIGGLGYMLPDFIINQRGRQRQSQIGLELPGTLDQLTISVEAGLGFDAALTRVATAGDGPLAEELMRLLSEIKVGISRAEAFRHLVDRTDVSELKHFALVLKQAEEFGLPIARVLRIQAAELRTKRRQRAEEIAMKIPVKIVFPLVLCIFPALFVVLLGPAVIRVMRVLM